MADDAHELLREPDRGLERMAPPDLVGHVYRGAHHAGDTADLVAQGGERRREDTLIAFAIGSPDGGHVLGIHPRLAVRDGRQGQATGSRAKHSDAPDRDRRARSRSHRRLSAISLADVVASSASDGATDLRSDLPVVNPTITMLTPSSLPRNGDAALDEAKAVFVGRELPGLVLAVACLAAPSCGLFMAAPY